MRRKAPLQGRGIQALIGRGKWAVGREMGGGVNQGDKLAKIGCEWGSLNLAYRHERLEGR